MYVLSCQSTGLSSLLVVILRMYFAANKLVARTTDLVDDACWWRNRDVVLTSHWTTAVSRLTSSCQHFPAVNISRLTWSTGLGDVYGRHGTPALTSAWRHATRAGVVMATSSWRWWCGVTRSAKQRRRAYLMTYGWWWTDISSSCWGCSCKESVSVDRFYRFVECTH